LLALDGGDAVAPTVLRFELSALRELGFLPSLEICVGCGEPVTGSGRIAFGMMAGGVLCGRCRSGQHSVVSVSGNAMQALREFAGVAPSVGRDAEFDARTLGELRGLFNNYVSHVLGHRPKMHKYLGT
jgi:DNA repair protein RecO (recombination protein O)